jgi:hypothetical protein
VDRPAIGCVGERVGLGDAQLAQAPGRQVQHRHEGRARLVVAAQRHDALQPRQRYQLPHLPACGIAARGEFELDVTREHGTAGGRRRVELPQLHPCLRIAHVDRGQGGQVQSRRRHEHAARRLGIVRLGRGAAERGVAVDLERGRRRIHRDDAVGPALVADQRLPERRMHDGCRWHVGAPEQAFQEARHAALRANENGAPRGAVS